MNTEEFSDKYLALAFKYADKVDEISDLLGEISVLKNELAKCISANNELQESYKDIYHGSA